MSERSRCLLSELLAALPRSVNLPGQDVTVTGISDDSRQVRAGTLFVAVPGVAVDGYRFIPQALESSAGAIVGEYPVEELSLPPDSGSLCAERRVGAVGWQPCALRSGEQVLKTLPN